MPIKTTAGSMKKIVANGNGVRAVFVGPQRVWPSGEAYFSWPHNTGLLMNSAQASIDATSLTKITESITACEMYQPAHYQGHLTDVVVPWWSSGVYLDSNGGRYLRLPANQGGKYRVQGTVDLWVSASTGYKTLETGSVIVSNYVGDPTLYTVTYQAMPVTDRWYRVAFDHTIENSNGYEARFYPFAVICEYSAQSQYPFAFQNVNVGITRVYT